MAIQAETGSAYICDSMTYHYNSDGKPSIRAISQKVLTSNYNIKDNQK